MISCLRAATQEHRTSSATQTEVTGKAQIRSIRLLMGSRLQDFRVVSNGRRSSFTKCLFFHIWESKRPESLPWLIVIHQAAKCKTTRFLSPDKAQSEWKQNQCKYLLQKQFQRSNVDGYLYGYWCRLGDITKRIHLICAKQKDTLCVCVCACQKSICVYETRIHSRRASKSNSNTKE